MSTKFCLFCLAPVKPEEDDKKIGILHFLNIWHQYLAQAPLLSNSGARLPTQRIDCCRHCNGYVAAFCELFKKWDVLRFQLHESLESLLNIMVAASRIGNRLRDESSQNEDVKKLRAPIIQMTKDKIAETLPQVVISPVYLMPTATPPPPEVEITWEPIRIELESGDINPDSDDNTEGMDFAVDDKSISTVSRVESLAINVTQSSSSADTRMLYDPMKPPIRSPFGIGPLLDSVNTVARTPARSGYSRAQYKCRVCKVPFSSYSSYRRHVSRSQSHKQKLEIRKQETAARKSAKKPEQLATRQSLEERQEKTHPKCFQCPHCEITCESKRALYRHEQKDHDGINKFTCGVCKKPFVDVKSLNGHAECHTDLSQCGFCGKKFLRKSDMKRHELAHTQGTSRGLCGILMRSRSET